jgi:hypothetical protein
MTWNGSGWDNINKSVFDGEAIVIQALLKQLKLNGHHHREFTGPYP